MLPAFSIRQHATKIGKLFICHIAVGWSPSSLLPMLDWTGERRYSVRPLFSNCLMCLFVLGLILESYKFH